MHTGDVNCVVFGVLFTHQSSIYREGVYLKRRKPFFTSAACRRQRNACPLLPARLTLATSLLSDPSTGVSKTTAECTKENKNNTKKLTPNR